jgi:hypothetical protein
MAKSKSETPPFNKHHPNIVSAGLYDKLSHILKNLQEYYFSAFKVTPINKATTTEIDTIVIYP